MKQGAKLLVGGKRNAAYPDGSFMEPTLIVDVTSEMDIARNEVGLSARACQPTSVAVAPRRWCASVVRTGSVMGTLTAGGRPHCH